MLAPLVNIELKINSDDNDSNIEDNNNSDDMNGDNYMQFYDSNKVFGWTSIAMDEDWTHVKWFYFFFSGDFQAYKHLNKLCNVLQRENVCLYQFMFMSWIQISKT